jgi:hypothetical protein
MTEPKRTMEPREIPPIPLAYIMDGEVVLVMNTDEKMAALFTSNPTVIQVTRGPDSPQVGWKWDGTNFTPPVSE